MKHLARREFLAGVSAAAAAALCRPCGAGESPWSVRFAICNETFQDWPLEKTFAAAATCGYAGVEIAPFTLANLVTEISAARRAEVRRQAEKAGLAVIGLHWLLAKTNGLHLTAGDAAVRRRTADYLAELARFNADVGGKLLVFGSPKQRDLPAGVTREEGLARAAEVFTALLPTLEKTDTVLAIEPLSPQTTNFLTTAAEGAELVRRVSSPRCRLHLDCLAMASEPTSIPELIRRHRGEFVHFHANDPNGQGPGFGKLDFAPVLQALKEVDYRGWVSVEVFDYSPGPERLARESLATLKRCLPRP